MASRGHSSDTLDLSFRELQDDLRNDEPLAFLEKRVVGRIGHGQKRPRGFAWPFDNAALGVESLDRRDTGQLTRSAMGDRFKLEQGNILRRRTGGATGDLAGDRTAIGQLPTRAGKVSTDRLAVDEQRRNGLAELPNELSVRTGLAVVDLCAFGVDGCDHRFVRSGDGVRYLRARGRGRQNGDGAGESNNDWQ